MRASLWVFIVILAATTAYSVDNASLEAASPHAATLATITLPQDHRGSEQEPLVITKPIAERERDEDEAQVHVRYELRTTRATEWLTGVTFLLALFTAMLWVVNRQLIKETNRAAARQASDTERAINEATRSANAMQDVAKATRDNAALMGSMFQKQMRAYISVDLGTATYQTDHLRFEAIPTFTNNGLTPAKNVCFVIMADILDGSHAIEAPPLAELVMNDAGLAPRQSRSVRKVVKDRVPDADVAAIMAGNTHRLFAWGRVTYEDVYGGSWHTNFFVSYAFFKVGNDWKVNGNYVSTHNDFS